MPNFKVVKEIIEPSVLIDFLRIRGLEISDHASNLRIQVTINAIIVTWQEPDGVKVVKKTEEKPKKKRRRLPQKSDSENYSSDKEQQDSGL